jgi:hypothetical protein
LQDHENIHLSTFNVIVVDHERKIFSIAKLFAWNEGVYEAVGTRLSIVIFVSVDHSRMNLSCSQSGMTGLRRWAPTSGTREPSLSGLVTSSGLSGPWQTGPS